MKKTTLIYALLFTSSLVFSQNKSEGLPISVGYFGNFLIQPGAKIGAQFSLNKWETEHEGKKGNYTKEKRIFVSPQVAFFSRPGNNMNLLVNADIGYQRKKMNQGSYSAVSLGLGYLLESQVVSIVYNLSDGSIKEKIREPRNYFLPTINYEFGHAIDFKTNWYMKFSLGSKLSPNRERSGVFFIELGMRHFIGKEE